MKLVFKIGGKTNNNKTIKVRIIKRVCGLSFYFIRYTSCLMLHLIGWLDKGSSSREGSGMVKFVRAFKNVLYIKVAV